MNIVAIVQARMNSTRLPGKVLIPFKGMPIISFLLERLAQAKYVNKIVVATTDNQIDEPLVKEVRSRGYEVFQGSEKDVLDRYYKAAKVHHADTVVRITGDCPLIDPQVVDYVIESYLREKVDYASNTITPTFPDGLDVEVFSFKALEKAAQSAQILFEREHVTPFLKKPDLFQTYNVINDVNLSAERWTLDEPSDWTVIQSVLKHFHPTVNFSWKLVMKLRQENPSLFEPNQHIVRNEGASLGTGQKLWKRAKEVISGGNMLLSKRSEMFLPEQWPSYFSRTKGCKVWDLDGKEYIDMSMMGVGTNTLGYSHPEVDQAVREVVDAGNMATLNAPEEVYVAERLVELHPWADMVRFARTGGEANAIAIRIARAATGRDKIAICGYHGWHDWYLAANLGDDKNLAGHLLPGLAPNGVPSNLQGTVLPFNYNNFAELETLISNHDVGVIKMEVVRNHEPQDNFLQKVRQLATARGIVLIFDECTSGFRQSFGGLHKLYDVKPDMAVFGKTLGNGYAITAILGRRDIMQAAQTSFISSTFWTERIGSAAALKTLEVMERLQSWERITDVGKKIMAGWKTLADKHVLSISVKGLPSLATFSFNSVNALAYKTLITQEMLAQGFLAGTSTYACIEHTPDILERYFHALDPVFALIKECESGRDVMALLKGPICHSGFKRLN